MLRTPLDGWNTQLAQFVKQRPEGALRQSRQRQRAPQVLARGGRHIEKARDCVDQDDHRYFFASAR